MRLPKLRDLTKSQTEVYLYAPQDEHVLISGPPGTGKTLIAYLRAIELKKRGTPVVLGMYSRVLAQYSSNMNSGPGDLPACTTVDAWMRRWWNSCGLPPHPLGGEIHIKVDFNDKDKVKAVGARWDSLAYPQWGGKKRGVWHIGFDEWEQNKAALASFPLYQKVPRHNDGDGGNVAWSAIADFVMNHDDELHDRALNLGTLLIDEGQDFPVDFYKLLRLLSSIGSARGGDVAHPLRCFVLADENQQLTELNSTLDEIGQALKIQEKHRYKLHDNFRNTCEIAALAASFYADVGTLPNLPFKRGERPVYTECINLAECIAKIRNWVISNPGKETGVLTFGEATRSRVFAALQKTIVSEKSTGREIKVQSYSWDTRISNKPEDLLFDEKDVVTVLNVQSCKGLEFDSVFIIDLHEARVELAKDRVKMQMFVATSRGREWVQILETRKSSAGEAFLAILPDEACLRREATTGSATTRPAPARPASPAADATSTAAKDDWAGWAKKYAAARKLEFVDMRPQGCIWVYAAEPRNSELEKREFAFSVRRQGWWRKE